MIKLNAPLTTAMITNYGLAQMMNLGSIKVFSGPQPDTADHAEQGTLLAQITQDGHPFVPGEADGGLQLALGPVHGTLQMQGAWVLKAVADGVPGWWRWVWNDPDPGTAGAVVCRIDGAVGEGLHLPADAMLGLTAGYEAPVAMFQLYLPPFLTLAT